MKKLPAIAFDNCRKCPYMEHFLFNPGVQCLHPPAGVPAGFASSAGRIIQAVVLRGEPVDIPDWCPLEDAEEKSTKEYTVSVPNIKDCT